MHEFFDTKKNPQNFIETDRAVKRRPIIEKKILINCTDSNQKI